MTYPARILWQPQDYTERWIHMLAQCVQVFGLPGGRYTTYVDANHMDFLFRDEQDRLLFLTGWPAHIPREPEHAC